MDILTKWEFWVVVIAAVFSLYVTWCVFPRIKTPPGYTDAEHDENGNPVDEELNG